MTYYFKKEECAKNWINYEQWLNAMFFWTVLYLIDID